MAQIKRKSGSSFDRGWFKARLADLDLTQRDYAARLDVAHPRVSEMFHGRRRMTLHEAKLTAQLLGVALEDVLRHAGALEAGEELVAGKGHMPITGWVDAGLVYHEEPPPVGTAVAPRPGVVPGAGAVEVARLILDGRAFDGGLAYWMRGAAGVDVAAIGRPCIVQVVGRMGLCLRIPARSYTTGYFQLRGLKEELIEPEAKLEWAAPVFLLAL